MTLPRPGLWRYAAGKWFTWDRIDETIWCRVRWRYPAHKLTGYWRSA